LRWTSEAVVAELSRVHCLGVVITYRGLAAAGYEPLAQAVRSLGGLRQFRQLAGIPPQKRITRPALSAAAVLDEIRRRHQHGDTLAASLVPPQLRSAACRRFGSWAEAITAAGFSYEHIRLKPKHTDEELIAKLRALAQAHPQMTRAELRTHRDGKAAAGRFGSTGGALRRAEIRGWPRRA
jgi:hypothetical protein